MIKSLGDVFVPILPAIVASGLMMGLVLFTDSDRGIRGKSIRQKYFPWGSHSHGYDSSEPDQCMVSGFYGCG